MMPTIVSSSAVRFRTASVDEILPLRHALLRVGRPLDAARFDGDDDADSLHFVAVHEGEAIACVSFLRSAFEGEPAWQLRGMAVAVAWQRHGIGRSLLGLAWEVLARAGGPNLCWCNARSPARAFYEHMGWRAVSEEFAVPGHGPHIRMIRRLPEAAPPA